MSKDTTNSAPLSASISTSRRPTRPDPPVTAHALGTPPMMSLASLCFSSLFLMRTKSLSSFTPNSSEPSSPRLHSQKRSRKQKQKQKIKGCDPTEAKRAWLLLLPSSFSLTPCLASLPSLSLSLSSLWPTGFQCISRSRSIYPTTRSYSVQYTFNIRKLELFEYTKERRDSDSDSPP